MRVLVAILAVALSPHVAAEVLAVLEHPQCRDDQSRIVRILFARDGTHWRPVSPSDLIQAGPMIWFPAAGGAAAPPINTLPASPPPQDDWVFARDYSLVPSKDSTLPEAPNYGSAFAGWCAAPKNRPIVLSSVTPSHQLAETQLSASPLSAAQRQAVLQALLKTYSSRALCAYRDKNETKARPIRIRTSDLVVLSNMKLPTGPSLVAIGLRRPAFECDSEMGATNLPRWFVLDQSPRYVGASMAFIRSVQASNSKSPDLLFWYSGYNEDGYILFDHAFSRSARFTWNYH
jgi:hypothetical protein